MSLASTVPSSTLIGKWSTGMVRSSVDAATSQLGGEWMCAAARSPQGSVMTTFNDFDLDLLPVTNCYVYNMVAISSTKILTSGARWLPFTIDYACPEDAATSPYCIYINTGVAEFLHGSDVETTMQGVLHAEELAPALFSDPLDQQTMFGDTAVSLAREFLPESVISFALSLVDVVKKEARRNEVSIMSQDWSLFVDPADQGKQLVLGVSVNATPEDALELWDKVCEKVEEMKQMLSSEDQRFIARNLSIQFYWP